MALPKGDCAREYEKFFENANGEVTVRVGAGGLLNGIAYDAVDVSYPTTTTEVYEFYTGGLGGTLVTTITLTYTNASKTDLSNAVRT